MVENLSTPEKTDSITKRMKSMREVTAGYRFTIAEE
jgi:hypothetical protein